MPRPMCRLIFMNEQNLIGPVFNGKKLKARRKSLGLTQAEVATQSGVDVSTVSRLERTYPGGKEARSPEYATIARVAQSLGSSVSEFEDGSSRASNGQTRKPTQQEVEQVVDAGFKSLGLRPADPADRQRLLDQLRQVDVVAASAPPTPTPTPAPAAPRRR